MSDREPKYLVGSRPVNRRTAARPAAPAPVAPAANLRARMAQVRSRLGSPLAEQLQARPATGRGAPSAATVAGGMLAACGGLGMFFAWLHGAPLAGVAGAAGLLGGLVLARPRRPSSPMPDTPATPLFDPESVAALDRLLGQLAGDLPTEVVAPLARIKQVIVRMGRHPAAGAVDEHFLVEDRLYANECLRRYLPDTLQAYLAVPPAQRGVALAGGDTPQGLLLQQLALLQSELEQREAKLARSASEALLRQQRFLQSKKS